MHQCLKKHLCYKLWTVFTSTAEMSGPFKGPVRTRSQNLIMIPSNSQTPAFIHIPTSTQSYKKTNQTSSVSYRVSWCCWLLIHLYRFSPTFTLYNSTRFKHWFMVFFTDDYCKITAKQQENKYLTESQSVISKSGTHRGCL